MRTLLLLSMFWPVPLAAQEAVLPEAEQQYLQGEVLSVSESVEVEILSEPFRGEHISLPLPSGMGQPGQNVQAGDKIIVQRIQGADGEVEYLFRERMRLPALAWLTLAFLLLGFVVGGRKGVTSLLGLAVSLAVLLGFVLPTILAGWSPLLICWIGSLLIACASLYLAHGFHRRTTIALLSTILTLTAAVLVAVVAVSFAKLFGFGTEEALFLQSGPFEGLDLRGVLLGGMVIGALGVLDDITTAQTAAINEVARANPRLDFGALYRSGQAIGREHVASLINTLALAYAGASLPLLLLLYVADDTPWWVMLNSAFLAEEIVRTLVGSTALLLAVPISTYLAAKSFAGGKFSQERGHSHGH